MSFLLKLFRRNNQDTTKSGGMEDFMTLIRVYFQASMAQKMGITNLSALPDLRVFKQTLHVATVNNRLGLGEKNRCKKMLGELYGLTDDFFSEIDASIKQNCRQIQDVQGYLYMLQGFSQDLLMLLSNTLQWKLRIPSIFKNTLRSTIAQGIGDVLTKDKWKDDATRKAAFAIRSYQKRLGFSQQWMTEYAYNIVVLAKKEPRPKDVEEKK